MTKFFRRALLSSLALSVLLVAAPAGATEEPPEDPQIFDIVFPVDGPNHYTDTYGECRDGCSRKHLGTDIMADKGVSVVAAADGHVVEVRGIDDAGDPVPGLGQWLIVDHGGWQTWYLHLNNDTLDPDTNDGLGLGIAPDIIEAYVEASGQDLQYPVEAGKVIGWVGNSGAEWSSPHLHFELRVGDHKWDSVAINPYPWVVAADPSSGAIWNGFFSDDDHSVHEAAIDELASDGTTRGCNPPSNTLYCPDDWLTRGHIAAFIRRTLDLPPSEEDYFTDDDGSVFNDDINAVMAAGIGFECEVGRFCPNQPLLREEMAEMLILAFAEADPDRYANPDDLNFFTDDEESPYQASINRLRAADVTRGCNPPDNDQFCPDRPLSRAEMATFFVRALGR